jgi:predicted phage replisome organizer
LLERRRGAWVMATGKKYYWLKLDRNFFKRHDIQVIESMTNGKDYILFYLKLLVESIDHEGHLRFSDTIPYDEKMLSVVTNTNIDIVRSAIKIFTELGLMDLFDDKTIYLTETQKMLGESSSTHRVQAFRERQKALQIETQGNVNETLHETEIEIEIDKEIEKEKSPNGDTKKRFAKPSVEEVNAYCQERKNKVDPQMFVDFYEAKGWMIGKNKMINWKAAVRTWENERQGNGSNGKPKKPDITLDWFDEYKKELEREESK